MAEDP